MDHFLSKSLLNQIKMYRIIYVVFVTKPEPELFAFEPQNYGLINLNRFKQIKEFNQRDFETNEHEFIGVLY